ncbi:hypothetical protein ACHAWF_018508 [Thalassiosira exigua]
MDLLNQMALGGYCIFFAVHCVLAGFDRTAARLTLLGQAAMGAFFAWFHAVVSPKYPVAAVRR